MEERSFSLEEISNHHGCERGRFGVFGESHGLEEGGGVGGRLWGRMGKDREGVNTRGGKMVTPGVHRSDRCPQVKPETLYISP